MEEEDAPRQAGAPSFVHQDEPWALHWLKQKGARSFEPELWGAAGDWAAGAPLFSWW